MSLRRSQDFLFLKVRIPILRPRSYPQGPNPSLEDQIPALKALIQPWRPKSSLATQISVQRPKSQSLEREGENSPHEWKHRSSSPLGPLPCSRPQLQSQPTWAGHKYCWYDHQTLLRLFIPIMQLKQTLNLICILQLYCDLKNCLNEIFFRCNDCSFVDHCPWV